MCPACGERPLGIGKPVCLACWRYTPINLQKAFHAAHKQHHRHPDERQLVVVLEAIIKEVIKTSQEQRYSIDILHAHEELANQRAQAGLEQ